jgi:hypothetical protein
MQDGRLTTRHDARSHQPSRVSSVRSAASQVSVHGPPVRPVTFVACRTVVSTPTYSSWLNLVERWFAELTEKCLRRGTYRSTKELEKANQNWASAWNNEPRPLVWHKTADEILESVASYCRRISDSVH